MPVSLASQVWLQIPQVAFFSAFQTRVTYSAEQHFFIFYDRCPFFPLLLSKHVFRPDQPQLHLPCAVTVGSGLVFFLYKYFIYQASKITTWLEDSNAAYMYDLDPSMPTIYFPV